MNWSSKNSHQRKEATLANGMPKISGDESNPHMLQALMISMTSTANQLEID